MNKKFIYTSLALALSFGAMAQQDKNAMKFSAPVNKDRAYSHLSILASDEYEGRETGKKGAWMAAEYIKKQFQSFGLVGPVKNSKDPYFQKVGLVSYDLTSSGFSINGKALQAYKDFNVPNGTVPVSGLNISANEVVFAGYGISKEGFDELNGLNLEDKVVMIFSAGDPTNPQAATAQSNDRAAMRAAMMARQKALGEIAKRKPKALLIIDLNFDKTPLWMKEAGANGRLMLKNEATAAAIQKSPAYASVTISKSTADEILKSSGTNIDALVKKITETVKPASQVVKANITIKAEKKENEVRAENVLGFLEGSDPKLKNEVLVVTGHYDHIGLVKDPNAKDKVNNGADDDGSGTTGVLLLAEAFSKAKKAGNGPKRSILFMTVCGEEKGLLGSEWYSENPVFAVENTIANLNTDMIGRIGEEYLGKPDSANYVYSIGSYKLSTDLGKLSEKVNDTYTKLKLDYKFDDPKDPQQIYYRSDHYNFAKLGIPVIFYYDGMLEQDYHQPGDEVSKINFSLLAKRAQLIYYTAWELANMPNRPVVDKKDETPPRGRN
ncbi:M28 family peptidase [Pedobacter montanisoli]|uniref:M28 family peptidase n=1 Tax=Pedobacter montanisoli TaxID=2923277 RepID=A0ABS9ZS95_9SPHI|nr:M28 family peptidase [Pedobacter montanisoli]MCJ0741445.1 M28 family peptidase [Pedobacter montanisoli]